MKFRAHVTTLCAIQQSSNVCGGSVLPTFLKAMCDRLKADLVTTVALLDTPAHLIIQRVRHLRCLLWRTHFSVRVDTCTAYAIDINNLIKSR